MIFWGLSFIGHCYINFVSVVLSSLSWFLSSLWDGSSSAGRVTLAFRKSCTCIFSSSSSPIARGRSIAVFSLSDFPLEPGLVEKWFLVIKHHTSPKAMMKWIAMLFQIASCFFFNYRICNSLWNKLHNLEGNHQIQVFLCKNKFFLSLWWVCNNGNSCYILGCIGPICHSVAPPGTGVLQAFSASYSKCMKLRMLGRHKEQFCLCGTLTVLYQSRL